jgi:hypothetical protein
VSRRTTLVCSLVLSSFIAPVTRDARAQGTPTTVSILRRTAVRTAPSAVATAIAYLNPSTFEVTQVRVGNGFVRLLLRDIDRRRPASGYGYIAAVDVAVDSGTTETASAGGQMDTVSRAPRATATPARPDTALRPSAAAPPASAPTAVAPPAAAPPAGASPTAAPAPAPQARQFALETSEGLSPHNVKVEPATHAGKRGVRVVISDDAQRRIQQAPGEPLEELAVIEGTDFANGVIEAEIAGTPGPGATQGARGFVGIAFRVQPDLKTYDAFYLRPTNGRADDQERRNHSAQYISHPAWTWNRLRQETPGRYEAYVDLVPDAWTPIRIEVRGARARLYVNGETQPTLIVNDVKSGEQGRGAIALWIDSETVAHFRNLRVSP